MILLVKGEPLGGKGLILKLENKLGKNVICYNYVP